MKITFSKTFEKNLQKINKKDIIQIIQKIEKLSLSDENLDIKKLSPKNLGYFRLRAGKYRIIFEYSNPDEINLLNVDNRDSIYLNI